MRQPHQEINNAVESLCSDLMMLDFSSPEEIESFLQIVLQIKATAQKENQEG